MFTRHKHILGMTFYMFLTYLTISKQENNKQFFTETSKRKIFE